MFDPETVGYMLQPNLTDHAVSDFQHWPPWRPLVAATAIELARYTGEHLIAPQTVLVRDYLEEISPASVRPGWPCSMCCSTPTRTRFATGSTVPMRHSPGGWHTWPGTGPPARG